MERDDMMKAAKKSLNRMADFERRCKSAAYKKLANGDRKGHDKSIRDMMEWSSRIIGYRECLHDMGFMALLFGTHNGISYGVKDTETNKEVR